MNPISRRALLPALVVACALPAFSAGWPKGRGEVDYINTSRYSIIMEVKEHNRPIQHWFVFAAPGERLKMPRDLTARGFIYRLSYIDESGRQQRTDWSVSPPHVPVILPYGHSSGDRPPKLGESLPPV